jgi:predicted secreted hydrolase
VKTSLPSQELDSATKLTPSYWEGSVTVTGGKGQRALAGVGYLEMTGYDRAFEMGSELK